MDAFQREEMSAAERERRAANLARVNSMAQNGLLRPTGAIYMDRRNRETIRDTVDIDSYLGFNRPVDKNEYLAMEKDIWNAVVDHWKIKAIGHDYDLVPNNMTMYPMVFERHTWYHCNLLVQRRDHTHPCRTLIFVEVKCKVECMKGMSYDVMACITLDENSCYNCKVCPTSRDILHPLRGGFTCGSKDGQKVFCYTIPVVVHSSGPAHNKATTLSPIRPTAMMKSTISLAATNFSQVNLDECSGLKGKQSSGAAHNKTTILSPTRPSALTKSTTSTATNFSQVNLGSCSGLKGDQGFGNNALKPTSAGLNLINQLIKWKQDRKIEIKERGVEAN